MRYVQTFTTWQEIWLGAYERRGSFQWDSDKSDVGRSRRNTYWETGQPNDDGHCMLLEPPSGTWWDRECSEQKSAVVCMLAD